QGLQTMDIAAGAIHRLRDQGPVRAFHAEFRYDAIRMQIDATVPANGSVLMLPPTTVNLDVHFNEPYDPATVRTNNLTLSQGSVTAASVVNADTARYTLDLSSITSEGTLTINFAAGALTDVFGNPMLAYTGSYILDFGTVAYPT